MKVASASKERIGRQLGEIKLIVDANVFKGFFESTMGNSHALCGCPVQLMSRISAANPVFHDSGRIIESEWEQMVDREWFQPWLASQLMAGAISYVDPIRNLGLEKSLTNAGFPHGRDVVYARVGLGAVAVTGSPCMFFTEDLDFYDPKKKKCPAKTRAKLLAAAAGPICKVLKKKDIHVSAVP